MKLEGAAAAMGRGSAIVSASARLAGRAVPLRPSGGRQGMPSQGAVLQISSMPRAVAGFLAGNVPELLDTGGRSARRSRAARPQVFRWTSEDARHPGPRARRAPSVSILIARARRAVDQVPASHCVDPGAYDVA